MNRANPAPQGPVPDFPERVTNVFEAQIAVNTRRQGVSSRQFEEDIASQGANRGAFAEGFMGSRVDANGRERPTQTYGRIQAGQESRRVEPGASNPAPSWAREPAILDEMFWGAGGDQGDAVPYPHSPRPGYNPSTITSLAGLNLGERRGTVYGYKIGDNPRRANEADVSSK
jgi:hypothetical protein